MSEPTRPHRRLTLIAWIVAVVVTGDAITKAIAVHDLEHRGLVSVFGGALHFELYRNFAGAGSMWQGHPVLVSVFSLAAVLMLCGFAWSARATGTAVAVGLLLGGGIGNLLDRIFGAPGPLRGGVVDWIKPTASSGSMNLADLAIGAGVLVLLAAVVFDLWERRRGHPRAQPPAPVREA